MILFSMLAASLPLFEFSGWLLVDSQLALHSFSFPPPPPSPPPHHPATPPPPPCFPSVIFQLLPFASNLVFFLIPLLGQVVMLPLSLYRRHSLFFFFQGLSFCVLVGWVGLFFPQVEFCCYCYAPYPALLLMLLFLVYMDFCVNYQF